MSSLVNIKADSLPNNVACESCSRLRTRLACWKWYPRPLQFLLLGRRSLRTGGRFSSCFRPRFNLLLTYQSPQCWLDIPLEYTSSTHILLNTANDTDRIFAVALNCCQASAFDEKNIAFMDPIS